MQAFASSVLLFSWNFHRPECWDTSPQALFSDLRPRERLQRRLETPSGRIVCCSPCGLSPIYSSYK